MTLTQHGPRCDVCGNYILLDRSLNPFTLNALKENGPDCRTPELHCHDRCKPAVLKLIGGRAGDQSVYMQLPDGPLKNAFVQTWGEPKS